MSLIRRNKFKSDITISKTKEKKPIKITFVKLLPIFKQF